MLERPPSRFSTKVALIRVALPALSAVLPPPLSRSHPAMFKGRQSTSSRSLNTLGGAPGTPIKSEVALSPRSDRYPHRLNLYERPPLDELTIEEFEVWAIDRLRRTFSFSPLPASEDDGRNRVLSRWTRRCSRLTSSRTPSVVLADIEAAQARNRPFAEIKEIVEKKAKEYLPLHADTSKGVDLERERKKDQYSHFILRLAFCRS